MLGELFRHLQRQKLRLPGTVLGQPEASEIDVVEVYAGKASLNERPHSPEEMCRLQT